MTSAARAASTAIAARVGRKADQGASCDIWAFKKQAF